MDHFPGNWGRPKQHEGQLPRPLTDGVQRTQQPIVTGTSVLAIKYKDGIMMAADNLASYGSLARFKDVQRFHAIGRYTVIGASGDMSDFQYIKRDLDEVNFRETGIQDGHELGPVEIHEYMTHVMYGRRSKMDPLWNSLIIGGFKDGHRFLSFVDLLGTAYTASTLASGYGAYIALPLLRKAVEGKEDILDKGQAEKILEDCMRILYYRDARSTDKYHIATITDQGVEISDPQKLITSWNFAEAIRGYGSQTQ